MKKTLLASALLSTFATSVLADGVAPVVKLGGYLNTQVGKIFQKDAFKLKTPVNTPVKGSTLKLTDTAIVNDTQIFVSVDGKTDTSGLAYGALVKLFADTSEAKYYQDRDKKSSFPAFQTMAYFEGAFGRLEAGSYTGVTRAFKVDATSFARATGGANGDAKYWWNPRTIRENEPTRRAFIETPNLFTNEEGHYGIKAMNAAKVNYYTPDLNGFRLGVSYTPDSKGYGTIHNQSTITKTSLKGGYVNIWEGGIHYAGQFNDVGFKAAVLGEMASIKEKETEKKESHSLKAWEAGANISYMGLNVGGSYGNWIQAGGSGNATKKTSMYWTAGLGYEYGALGASFDYFESKLAVETQEKKNKLQKLTFGLDYKLAPGLLPYAEVSVVKFRDHHEKATGGARDAQSVDAESNKATVFLVGSKLQF